MKNTFDTLDRKSRLILMLATHRQERRGHYTPQRWNAVKMSRYRWKKRLLEADPETLHFDELCSHCLYVNPRDPKHFRVLSVKGRDVNLEVTRMMKQLLGGRKYGHRA